MTACTRYACITAGSSGGVEPSGSIPSQLVYVPQAAVFTSCSVRPYYNAFSWRILCAVMGTHHCASITTPLVAPTNVVLYVDLWRFTGLGHALVGGTAHTAGHECPWCCLE